MCRRVEVDVVALRLPDETQGNTRVVPWHMNSSNGSNFGRTSLHMVMVFVIQNNKQRIFFCRNVTSVFRFAKTTTDPAPAE